jgi:hypothetical protein
VTDSGRTVFGAASGSALRIPPSDEVGVPLGRNTTEALSGVDGYRVVWNRNDDSGSAFVGEVSFPEQTSTLNAAHDTLSPDDGIYRVGWQLDLEAGVADAEFYIASPGAGAHSRIATYFLAAGKTMVVGDSILFLSYLNSIWVEVNNLAGNLSVKSGNLYAWKLS